MALGIAASRAAGIKQNFGTMTKPVQVGLAASNGLSAALMAQAGITASPVAFEGLQGFGPVFNGPGRFRFDAIDSLGVEWDLLEPGLVVKQYPCCGSTHPAVDAVRALREEFSIDPDRVERVRVYLHPRRLRHTNRPIPGSPLEAKFSVQYAVAVALREGHVRLHHFSEEVWRDPVIRATLSKVEADALPEERWGPEHFAAEVVVQLDGRELFKRVEKARGRGPRLALSREELEGKFYDCAGRVLTQSDARRLCDMVWRLEWVNDLSELFELLRGRNDPQLPEPLAGQLQRP